MDSYVIITGNSQKIPVINDLFKENKLTKGSIIVKCCDYEIHSLDDIKYIINGVKKYLKIENSY